MHRSTQYMRICIYSFILRVAESAKWKTSRGARGQDTRQFAGGGQGQPNENALSQQSTEIIITVITSKPTDHPGKTYVFPTIKFIAQVQDNTPRKKLGKQQEVATHRGALREMWIAFYLK